YARGNVRSVKTDRFRVRECRLGALGSPGEIISSASVVFGAFEMISERRRQIVKPLGEQSLQRAASVSVQLCPTRQKQRLVCYFVGDHVLENELVFPKRHRFGRLLLAGLDELASLQA